MRRLATLVTTIALAMSGMIFSPAHAVAPSNGDYVCTTGLIKTTETTNLYTITTTGSVTSVTSHSSGKCAGVVVIPDGVTSIGNSAFQNATSLTSITLPVGLKTISNYAFFEASSLTSITIPAAVTSIGNVTFYGTTSLTSFTVASGNTTYAAIAGVLFKVLPKTLMSYPANASDTSYTIPADVTTIAGYAFFKATSLTSITISASGTDIADNAFAQTTSLTSFTVVPSDTPSLDTLISTNGVLFKKVSTTLVPTTLVNYPAKASDTSYTIPATVKTINGHAFYGATSLTTITIPASAAIGQNAFVGTTSLTSFTVVPSDTPSLDTLTSTNGVLFNKASTTLWYYPANASDTSYTIPATVGTIAGYAFYGATTLTSITIPSSVTSFYAYAFQNATSLTSVYFLDNAPTSVNTTPFLNVASGAKAYIKSGATGFTTSGTPALWNGLIVEVVADTTPAVIDIPPAAVDTPATSVDTPVQVVDTVLVALTVSAKKKYSGKALAKKVGVTIVSSKASVSISVAEKSKKICARSYSNLKTLKAGKCVVTFTVQEPKSKKGKKPKATKTTTTLVVQ